MAQRATQDPYGHGLASSVGVQGGMALVVPGYGASLGVLQTYSGIKNDNKVDIGLGLLNLSISTYGAYRSASNYLKSNPIKSTKVELMGGLIRI